METVRLYRLSGIETLRERFRAVRVITNTYGAPLSDEDITLWLVNLFTGASGFTVDIWNKLNINGLTEESFVDDINVGTRISGGMNFYNMLQDKISNKEINSTEDFREFVTYFKNDVLTELESKALLDQFILNKYSIEQISQEVPTVDLDSQVYVHYPYDSETDVLAVYDLDSGVIVKTIKGSEHEPVIEEDKTAESVMSQKQLEDMEHQAKKETEELQELMKRDKAVDSENKTIEGSEDKVESVAHFGPTVKKEDRKEFDFSTAQDLVLYDKQLKSKYIEIYIIGAKKYGVLGIGKLYETGRVFVYNDLGGGTWYSNLSSAYRELCTQKIGEFVSCNYFKSTCDIEGMAVDNYRGNESYKQLHVMDVIQNYCLFRVDFTPIAKGLGTIELRSDELNKYVKIKDIDSAFCTYENNYNYDSGWYTLYYIIEKMCKDMKCAINKFRVEAILKTFKPSDMRFSLSDLITIGYEKVIDGITEFIPDSEFMF